jgi:DNA-binding transcriptional MerR regulator
MFKIGDFSKISQVSVKTLHHYDAIGLLKPAAVDPSTGYRHYTIDQLSRVNRILALKELGFSLEHVAQFLNEEISFAALCVLLQAKETELVQHIAEEQARLVRVTARLRLIQQEGRMATYEVVIRRIEPIRVVRMREIMPTIPHMGRRIGEVMETLANHGMQATGPLMTLFYHTGFREEDLDIEIAVPVADTVTIDAVLNDGTPLTMSTLPAIPRMACLVYQGAYETLSEPYATMGRWFAEHGYQLQLPGRERYLERPHDGLPVTEIQFPIG